MTNLLVEFREAIRKAAAEDFYPRILKRIEEVTDTSLNLKESIRMIRKNPTSSGSIRQSVINQTKSIEDIAKEIRKLLEHI
jgi:NADH:ubiquinone oxidoreductase subunit D